MHRSAAHAEAAHVPAFPKRDAHLVFCFKKSGHIIGLIPHIGIIVIPARGQIIVSDALSVQFCPVNAQTCDFKDSAGYTAGRKTPDKNRLLDGWVCANPFQSDRLLSVGLSFQQKEYTTKTACKRRVFVNLHAHGKLISDAEKIFFLRHPIFWIVSSE